MVNALPSTAVAGEPVFYEILRNHFMGGSNATQLPVDLG